MGLFLGACLVWSSFSTDSSWGVALGGSMLTFYTARAYFRREA